MSAAEDVSIGGHLASPAASWTNCASSGGIVLIFVALASVYAEGRKVSRPVVVARTGRAVNV